jgi:hypothetical protein
LKKNLERGKKYREREAAGVPFLSTGADLKKRETQQEQENWENTGAGAIITGGIRNSQQSSIFGKVLCILRPGGRGGNGRRELS